MFQFIVSACSCTYWNVARYLSLIVVKHKSASFHQPSSFRSLFLILHYPYFVGTNHLFLLCCRMSHFNLLGPTLKPISFCHLELPENRFKCYPSCFSCSLLLPLQSVRQFIMFANFRVANLLVQVVCYMNRFAFMNNITASRKINTLADRHAPQCAFSGYTPTAWRKQYILLSTCQARITI